MRGLLGKTLSHSYSKRIHEEIDGVNYNLIELDELDSFFQEKLFSGINVTIPYKTEVIKYIDTLSHEASATNSVNTIINNNGSLTGYNTDYYGLEYTLKYNNISLKDKVVGILGNGATTRTIKYLCNQKSAKEIIIFARNPKDKEYTFDSELLESVQILFNATPNGMYPNIDDDILINVNKLKSIEFCMDLVYNPLRTKLILALQERGIKAVNGLMMLVHQAVKANELFNKMNHSNEVTNRIYKKILLETINIVLIGMPMSGKSYFTRQVNRVYNKTIQDVDAIIEQTEKKSIPEIFEEVGENGFRNIETREIIKLSKSTNQAISTGGGVVLNKINIDYLKQNGLVVFLDMPLQYLKQCNPKNRPLLKNPKNIEKLYKERYPLYNRYADKRVLKRGFKRKETLHKIEVKINEYINT